MSDKQAKDKRKGKPGRPPSHGGYSVIIRAGELPKRRTYIRAYLQEAHDDLTRDLGHVVKAFLRGGAKNLKRRLIQ